MLKKFDEDKVPTCVDFSPNGKFLSVSTKKGEIYFYEGKIKNMIFIT
jgi:hypothetical protein